MKDDSKCKIRGVLLDHERVHFNLGMTDIPTHCGDNQLWSTLIILFTQ